MQALATHENAAVSITCLMSRAPCRLQEKIRKLDEQLKGHREQIKRCRPGPAQEAAKRRALQVGFASHPVIDLAGSAQGSPGETAKWVQGSRLPSKM